MQSCFQLLLNEMNISVFNFSIQYLYVVTKIGETILRSNEKYITMNY